MRRSLLVLAVLLVALPARAADKRPLTIDDMFRFQRVADPQISPNGKLVAYALTSVDLARNQTSTSLWLVPTDKGEPRQFTSPGPGKKDRHPRWSPDGKHLLFESNRGGDYQLWIIDLTGGEARKLTDIATEANNALWSRDGKQIAFASAVFPENSEKPFKESNELNKKRQDEAEKGPVKAKVFTKLFYRHWDSYVEDKRQHLFVMAFADGKTGEPKDVTPGDRDAFPTSSTFETDDNFTFSPDGTHLLFTAVPEKDEAWSTNYDICRVPVSGEASRGRKPTEWEVLTKDNPAADSGPRFSPDGKKLAYRAQKKAGYEADRWELLVVDSDGGGAFQGKPRSVIEFGKEFDHSVDSFLWGGNETLLFTAESKANTPIFQVSLGDSRPKSFPFLSAGKHGSMSRDLVEQYLVFTVAALDHPAEVYIVDYNKPVVKNLSQANTKLLAELDLPRPESVTVEGAGGTPMQMWILKPPGFDEKKRWPVAYLVHGGPQGAWEDGWSYRWNPELWAAQGYVVALPNPRGSTGFGQKYVDEISGDWGGKCYRDLMAGVEYLAKLPYIDKDRMAAAGASFGGYMMNWFAVNTGRFKTLIMHCGVWDFDSMYATTDEVWFDEFEHGGPPWGKNRESYEKFSPHKYAANLGKLKTPMLVIQNDLDFRCPVGQGQELFTALKRQGVESRFINFPDEGHWVLKPANSAYWHKEVFAWLKKYVAPGGR